VTPERWRQVKAVLDGALERRPGERPAFVAAACEDDAELRQEVESLLSYEAESTDFIEEPLFGRFAGGLAEGQRVGPYEVVREIGRGGMGAVYLAVRADEDFDQRVALKLVGLGSAAEIVRRFRAERQILAHLDHPNIAKLLDGGTAEDGRPYFVMEYVEGRPIDEYAGKLPLRERLALFREVCAAVHFAHQNLVVHRDLKPGNILVTGDGVPKLLDFGIAKLLDPGGTDPGLSELGLRPMTLRYASPEQVRGEPITTGSDVYSLGVLLHVLLTGRSPYAAAADDRPALERAILQGETVRPSQAVAKREEARRLAGDLDTIVLRAMDPEPGRRYASAEQLAADVQRHLDGLPVLARKNTASYRLNKFVRRHKAGVAAAAAVLLLILGFSVTVTLLLQRAQRERDRAEAVSGFLEELFVRADPSQSRGETVTVREALDRGRQQIAGGLQAAPETRASLMETMGRVYRSLGLHDQARPLLEESLRIRRSRGQDPVVVASSEINLALTLHEMGEKDEAEPFLRDGLEILRRQRATATLEYAAGLNNLGGLLVQRGETAAAEALFREALSLKQKIPGSGEEVARAYDNLGYLLYGKGDIAAAEPYLRKGLLMRRGLFGGEPHPDLAISLNNLASLLEAKRELSEAETLYREVLAMRRKLYDNHHPKIAASLSNLAFVLLAEGRPAEAEPFAREALAITSPDNPNRAVFLRHIAAALAGQGKGREAEPLAREALASFQSAPRWPRWRAPDAESVLGSCLAAQGRYAEAEPLLLGAYRGLLADRGEGAHYAPAARQRIVNLYTSWGRPDRAAVYRSEEAPTAPSPPAPRDRRSGRG
jgi:serine/threonine protein kinase/Tfp pilus assembly protein PilF